MCRRVVVLIFFILNSYGNAFAFEDEVSPVIEPNTASVGYNASQIPLEVIQIETLTQQVGLEQDETNLIELDEQYEIYFDQNTADESSVNPHIPEPMVFDLVRPLGAKKGELEINVLGLHMLREGVEWAPEIEYAFKDGHAVELELPFKNNELEAFKLAYQLTLPRKEFARYAHGLQTITRYNLDAKSVSVEPLYLFGYELTPRFSIMTITGMRANMRNRGLNLDLLVNPSLFYHVNKRISIGLENNLRLRSSKNYDLNLIPQLLVEFGKNASIQVGAGLTRQQSGVYRPLAGMRLIMTLH